MTIIAMFMGGATALYFIVNPFLSSMLGVATTLGVSHFIFVQWVAPFLSEFPEKVTAFYWAKRITTAPMAIMNMVSSNINQWTMLAAMIPIAYSIGQGQVMFVPLDEYHRLEILLTVAQSMLGFMLLAELRFRWYEALGLFTLWLVQFLVPHLHGEVMIAYFGWVFLEGVRVIARRRNLRAFPIFLRLVRENFGTTKKGKGGA
jgi:cation:H+ antiporter